MHLTLILGTNREGRKSERVAMFLKKHLGEREDIELSFFDVQDFDLPKVGYGQDIKDQFPEYRDTVNKSDGFIMIVPEYNHGYPGRLKSVLDILLPEFNNKPVLLTTVSSGMWGGTRVAEAMLPVLRELGLVVLPTDVNVLKVSEQFNEEGEPQNDIIVDVTNKQLKNLLWMAETLKWGRENIEK